MIQGGCIFTLAFLIFKCFKNQKFLLFKVNLIIFNKLEKPKS